MSYLTLSSELATLLVQIQERTEIRDTEGNIIGVFTPREKCDAKEWDENAFDLEEADRILEEQKNLPWHTLEEIWRKVGRFKDSPQ